MAAERYREELGAELLAGPAAGLDRVAVGAQGDHLGRVVGPAQRQVPDVVDLQDRATGPGLVLDVTATARVLAPAAAGATERTRSAAPARSFLCALA